MGVFNTFFDKIEDNNIVLSGINNELFSIYAKNTLNKANKNIIILTSSLYEANMLYLSLQSYTDNVFLFPMDDFITSEAIAISPDLMISRLETINEIIKQKNNKIIITNLMGYLRYLPTNNLYKEKIIKLEVNNDYDIDKLKKELYSIGYKKETLVTKTGEYGVRGFVIDVFPLGEKDPIRLEFFGDSLESIRTFDPDTQKSIKEIKKIEIFPYSEFLISDIDFNIENINHKQLRKLSNNNINSISNYLDNPITIYVDYNQIMISYEALQNEIFDYQSTKDQSYSEKYMFDFNEIKTNKVVRYNTLNNYEIDKNFKMYSYSFKELPNFNSDPESIKLYISDQLKKGKTVIVCIKEYQISNFVKYINIPYNKTTEENIFDNQLNIIVKNIHNGFIYNDYIVLSEKELFNIKENKSKYKTNFKYSSKIKDYNKLNVGDYVVHNIHGIGIYNGVKTLGNKDLLKDYLEILYQGKDKLYIPVEKIDLISKFSGKEGMVPKINKLNGTEWEKVKLRVKNKIHDIADKLLKLYALRESQKGYAFSKDNELQYAFEKSFGFEETKDQLRAVDQIKEDMESIKPMDRLLCGDVGYGKTEVAFRAMFKAVLDSKQVLYLCPTTILSNQHYINALERFKEFPVNIKLLNRFTTTKEKKEIVEVIKNGTVDIVIGTHRLLSNDIKPKNLGLLVIDEEQRFGVVHKEKIKEYKNNVDVLTLTATPIPRTLQMSLVGIRSLSLIETPPVDRYPIQTYVIEENKSIIKDAIYKELSRNGQIFLLYNKVESIEEEKYKIQALVPNAKIVIAHGQLSKTEIEERMMQFINKEYDILLCTTIIETGIDIPNVNTLIILDADKFGLSQLYQIRGRVGRSNKIAYAYLMYNPKKILSETATKRLSVIKEFTELGSGFSIATRDLSIRGAGDILGSEQAGFIDTIGIDLYIKMLNEEVALLKGEQIEEEKADEKPLLNVSTHIEDNYVEDVDLKIEIHKLINEIDSSSKLQEIKEIIEDRFGTITETMNIYMYEEWFEKLAKQVDIVDIKQTKNSIEMRFSKEITKTIDGEKLFTESFKITPMFRFMMKNEQLIIILDTIKLEKHYLYYLIDLLNIIKNN